MENGGCPHASDELRHGETVVFKEGARLLAVFTDAKCRLEADGSSRLVRQRTKDVKICTSPFLTLVGSMMHGNEAD
jgi:hypothetical protein